jgi:hypothetical protein
MIPDPAVFVNTIQVIEDDANRMYRVSCDFGIGFIEHCITAVEEHWPCGTEYILEVLKKDMTELMRQRDENRMNNHTNTAKNCDGKATIAEKMRNDCQDYLCVFGVLPSLAFFEDAIAKVRAKQC